jgi:glycosyltransferase involved in cell wall biosynthesis
MGQHGPEADERSRLAEHRPSLLLRIATMKILFLVRALIYGGAERQLVVLANELAKRGHEVAIAPFYTVGLLEQEIDSSRVRFIPLGKRSRWDLLLFYGRLIRVVQRERPDILHGWMATPNLVATMVRPLYPKVRVFWCIRSANLEVIFDRVARTICWFERRLSHFADCIVVNSRAGVNHAAARGFPLDKMICIPNGIDVNGLYLDPPAGQRVRVEWGFTQSERLIGLVGRFDPIKDHPNFLRAAARLAQQLPEVRFVCIGDGPTHYRVKLEALSRELGLEQKVMWVPARPDVRAVYNALDVVCLCSLSEGFPNVIGEAMACGRHCVVTDVGDCRFLVGDAGVVVPPNDPEALAEGLRQVLSVGRKPNEQGRQRVLKQFTVTQLTDRTEKVLVEFCADHRETVELRHAGIHGNYRDFCPFADHSGQPINRPAECLKHDFTVLLKDDPSN